MGQNPNRFHLVVPGKFLPFGTHGFVTSYTTCCTHFLLHPLCCTHFYFNPLSSLRGQDQIPCFPTIVVSRTLQE